MSKALPWRRIGEPWSHPPGTPYIAMVKTFDIDQTIAGAIRNAAPGLVAVALCRLGGRDMIEAAKAAAKERGIRILWWNGPVDNTVPPEARPDLKKLKAMTYAC